MKPFALHHILIPVSLDPDDDPKFVESATAAGCELARCFSARITLINLAPSVNPGTAASVDVSGQIYQTLSLVLQARLTRGRSLLAELQKQIEAKNIAVDTRILEGPESPAQAICDAAKNLGVDLIVIGSHGRKGIKRVLLGSTAEQVAHLAHCPVLLVRPNEGA